MISVFFLLSIFFFAFFYASYLIGCFPQLYFHIIIAFVWWGGLELGTIYEGCYYMSLMKSIYWGFFDQDRITSFLCLWIFWVFWPRSNNQLSLLLNILYLASRQQHSRSLFLKLFSMLCLSQDLWEAEKWDQRYCNFLSTPHLCIGSEPGFKIFCSDH